MPRVSTKNSSASQAARDLLPSKPVGRWLVVLTLVAAVLGVDGEELGVGAAEDLNCNTSTVELKMVKRTFLCK